MSTLSSKYLGDGRLQETLAFARGRNESTHWAGCEAVHIYCALEMALSELVDRRAHETLPVSVEFGGAHKGGYPKSGDRCHHCSGEWLPSPDGKGVWHNCHTGPATATVDPLSKVYDAFSIGSAARVPSTLLANVENARRRSECLSRIEHEFFTRTVQDEDGEDTEECPLSWGAEPAEYVEQFRGALAERDAEKAPVTSYAVAYDKLGWVCSICAGWNHPGNHICEHRSRPEHQPHAPKASELQDEGPLKGATGQ